MTQSVGTALSPSAESLSADQAGDSAHRNGAASPQSTQLGYEVLYSSRRPGRLHLPLSMPVGKLSGASTGSALLDSFERDRAQKSIPLRNLRLVAIAGLQATTPTPSVPIASKPTAVQADLQLAVGRANPVAPPAPANSAVLPSTSPDRLDTQVQPPAKQPPAKQPQLRRPDVKHGLTRLPASQHPVSARPGHLPVNTGKVARDSAAAVGLLDLNDTLLFGGDHEDLSCVDPFVAFQSSVRPAEVLDYLSHQVSAFTVERLKHNFPITTHLEVLNRVAPPAYGTVLESQFFRLKDLLAEEDSEAENTAEPGAASSSDSLPAPSADLDATEIHALSKQVQDLNKKIEYLSRKLEEASGSEITP